MIAPSAITPRSLPLPAQRTVRQQWPWLRQHSALAGVLTPLVSAVAAMIAGIKLDGMSFVTAFKTLGFPVGSSLTLLVALGWTYLLYLPKLMAEEEQRRQLQLEQHNEDRAAFLQATHQISERISTMDTRVNERLARIEEDIEATAPR